MAKALKERPVEALLYDANDLIRKKNRENEALRGALKRAEHERDTAEQIRKVIYGIAEHSPAPPKWLDAKRESTSSHRGAPCTIWSDWHYGERIDPDQVGGVNEFNPEIAQTRVKKLVSATIDLCNNHMGRSDRAYPGIVVMLGGDMISGNIHEELARTNVCTPQQQVNETIDLLMGAIDGIATNFPRVFIPAVPGNHGRDTLKPPMKNAVFHSYDWNIYCALAREFRKHQSVRFFIPNETDAHFTVFGHRYLLTHGDNLGVKGGDGIIGAIGPIMRGSMKVRSSEAEIGRGFDTACICHWHQYITLPGLIVNNSLKGFDEYARLRLRAKFSRPSQALWFTHPQQGITAHWQIYLEPKFKKTDIKDFITWVE